MTRPSRAIGCLSLVLMVGAVPALAAGLLIYRDASRSAQAHDGAAGALSGLTEIMGIGLAALGVIAFLVGAIFLVRSARE